MMIGMEEKLRVIIGQLIKKTKSRQLIWDQLNENAYIVRFRDCRIVLNNQMISFREKKKITLLIYNTNDEVVTSVDDTKNKYIKELHQLAHQNYYKFDETMDMIIQELA
jgi:hypothetical protein